MTHLYPRLDMRAAAERLQEIRLAVEAGEDLKDLVADRHPQAVWAPTGGAVCQDNDLQKVRESVLAAVQVVDQGERSSRGHQMRVDLAVGRALSESMDVNPADAGHDSVWAFLTLVVLPDVAAARFPDLHEDRMFGGHRNTFRRLWLRERAVGDLMREAPYPLGEDEMVGIFERSELARNRNLSRAMAKTVLESTSANRSEFARSFYKRVRFHTGAYALDLHTEDELVEVCMALSEDIST